MEFLTIVLVAVALAGGLFYGFAYLKARAEGTTVAQAIVKLLTPTPKA